MLIKIDSDRYINSDHIVRMHAGEQDRPPAIFMDDGAMIITDWPIILYIARILNADETFTTETPPALSLKSRLAQHLRNQSDGQSLQILSAIFPLEAYLETALNELNATNTIRALGDPPLYYHASNPIFGVVETEF